VLDPNGLKVQLTQISSWLINVHNYARIMYKGGTFMPKIKPISELRNTNEISELCHAELEPIFITKNGYGDLVVMSIETYEQLLQVNIIDRDIMEAKTDKDTELIDARETFRTLKKKRLK